MDILDDLEILILQNEDDFDRGSGKYILRQFIEEKKAEQLKLCGVVVSEAELCETFFSESNTTSATKCKFCNRESWEH